MNQRVQSLSEFCLQIGVRFSFGFLLAVVAACGGGGSSAETTGAASPAPFATDPKSVLALQTPATGLAAGRAQTLAVTASGNFSRYL